MTRRIGDFIEDWFGLIALFGLFFILFLGVYTCDSRKLASYSNNCVEAGGHIYKPDSISFCVSADGRWIEVYP